MKSIPVIKINTPFGKLELGFKGPMRFQLSFQTLTYKDNVYDNFYGDVYIVSNETYQPILDSGFKQFSNNIHQCYDLVTELMPFIYPEIKKNSSLEYKALSVIAYNNMVLLQDKLDKETDDDKKESMSKRIKELYDSYVSLENQYKITKFGL